MHVVIQVVMIECYDRIVLQELFSLSTCSEIELPVICEELEGHAIFFECITQATYLFKLYRK